jgi:hypothetical protein
MISDYSIKKDDDAILDTKIAKKSKSSKFLRRPTLLFIQEKSRKDVDKINVGKFMQ